MGSLPEENLKITFFTDAPFIVKFRFEKYRYLLTFLLCIQIFEAPLSHSHSTGPQNISAGRLVPLSVACLVWWHSFRPQIYDESKTDQILNAKYFVWNNYTLGKWGSRKAFNQNSLMQLFNGDRPIVHCIILPGREQWSHCLFVFPLLVAKLDRRRVIKSWLKLESHFWCL